MGWRQEVGSSFLRNLYTHKRKIVLFCFIIFIPFLILWLAQMLPHMCRKGHIITRSDIKVSWKTWSQRNQELVTLIFHGKLWVNCEKSFTINVTEMRWGWWATFVHSQNKFSPTGGEASHPDDQVSQRQPHGARWASMTKHMYKIIKYCTLIGHFMFS